MRRLCIKLKHCAHARQHGCIDAVGLGALADRLGELAGPVRVYLDQAVPGRTQHAFQIAMVAAGCLVDHPNRPSANPASEPPEPRLVVVELPVRPVRQTVNVDRVFGNVDTDGILHRLSSPVLVMRGRSTPPHVSVQVIRKAGAIILLTGSEKPSAFRPDPRRSPACMRCRRAAPVSHESRADS
jgi:hypothetical protein